MVFSVESYAMMGTNNSPRIGEKGLHWLSAIHLNYLPLTKKPFGKKIRSLKASYQLF
jgi:hypothetical protein